MDGVGLVTSDNKTLGFDEVTTGSRRTGSLNGGNLRDERVGGSDRLNDDYFYRNCLEPRVLPVATGSRILRSRLSLRSPECE